MRILITGGTGFVGKRLCKRLLDGGHQLTVFSRQPARVKALCGESVEAISDLQHIRSDSEFDAVINLAGEPIAEQRWTAERKAVLLESRLATTRQLVDAMGRMDKRPKCLISASAIGFYGDQGNAEVDEHSTPNEDFAHQLCAQWEQMALQAEVLGVRVCVTRIGLVVGRDGGFVSKMLLPFKLGLGGRFGSGEQWMSWVHRDDLIGLMLWLLEHEECRGVYNATAPNPVTNGDFTKTLAGLLGRPALLPMPALIAKLIFGEMASLFLTGQKVLPKRITEAGYQYQYPELSTALQEALP